jgi:hypothetical protein
MAMPRPRGKNVARRTTAHRDCLFKDMPGAAPMSNEPAGFRPFVLDPLVGMPKPSTAAA